MSVYKLITRSLGTLIFLWSAAAFAVQPQESVDVLETSEEETSKAGTAQASRDLARVSLGEEMTFQGPGGSTVTVEPGEYDIKVGDESVLQVISADDQQAVVISAETFQHETKMDAPIAIYAEGAVSEHHLVVLQPTGMGFFSVGWSGDVRRRGVTLTRLPRPYLTTLARQKLYQTWQTGKVLKKAPVTLCKWEIEWSGYSSSIKTATSLSCPDEARRDAEYYGRDKVVEGEFYLNQAGFATDYLGPADHDAVCRCGDTGLLYFDTKDSCTRYKISCNKPRDYMYCPICGW